MNSLPAGFPSLNEFVTEDYVKGLLATGKWSGHGSSLDSLFKDLSYYPEWSEGKNIADPADRETILRKWLPLRYAYVAREIAGEMSMATNLRRALLMPEGDIRRFLSTPGPVGVFWSTRPDCDCWGAAPKPGSVLIWVETAMDKVSVDWPQTLVSRFDYENGDIETEIRLIPGTVLETPFLIDEKGGKYPFTAEKTV